MLRLRLVAYAQGQPLRRGTMTNQTKGFHLYLQVRIGALFGDDVRLTTCLDGREVTIRASDGAQPISKAEWLIFEACGFPTEQEARAFGERLRANVDIAAFCSGLGVDTGPDEGFGSIKGEDRQSEGRPKPHPQHGPALGLSIRSDDDKPAPGGIWGAVTTASDTEIFLEAMRELADQPSIAEHTIAPVRLLNLALITFQPLARLVLAISAVESRVEDRKWSGEQRDLIDKLATEIPDPEVKEAVEHLHRISIRQGIKRVLKDNSIDHLWKEWDALYKRRSRLFHGDGNRWGDGEIVKLSSDAIQLCRKIIFATIKRDGIPLPFVACVNFKGI